MINISLSTIGILCMLATMISGLIKKDKGVIFMGIILFGYLILLS